MKRGKRKNERGRKNTAREVKKVKEKNTLFFLKSLKELKLRFFRSFDRSTLDIFSGKLGHFRARRTRRHDKHDAPGFFFARKKSFETFFFFLKKKMSSSHVLYQKLSSLILIGLSRRKVGTAALKAKYVCPP